ncbi:putative phosphohydrolase [Lachnospiraceae bacterium JC7]|nr:putative phosphohydrolase [Lachnospiraceae bacterium JC7]
MDLRKTSRNRIISAGIVLLCILLTGSVLTACGGSGGSQKADESGKNGKDSGLEQTAAVRPALREDPIWRDDESVKAFITSDLHYTGYREVDHMSVPGMAVAEEITDTIVNEVIAKHPDVFIMTGDNTNSGYTGDVSELVSKLQKIKDSGIPIILTTGNHDFDLMDEAEYEKLYFGLLEPVDRDKASLSYTAIVRDVVFLAMDDKALHLGAQGEFSQETMKWLGEMLEKYKGYRIIFLSHHNVLYGANDKGAASHVIHNTELPDILRSGGVKLAITGHMHSQYITESEGLWEVLSGMPFSGRHLIGELAIGKDRMVYCAEPIDFSNYGSDVKPRLEELERESAEFMHKTLVELLESEGLSGQKKDNVLKLIDRFLRYYEEGSLAEHKQELKADPVYKDMIESLWNHNYGPWMQSMVETTRYSGRELELRS